MDNEVKFRISIEDSGSSTLKTVGVNADDLRAAIHEVNREMNELEPSVVNFAQLSQGIDAVTGVVDQLHGAFKELTSMSQAQVEVETKLSTAMRNTMGATDAEIQSIKDLCSAQQELGIIGDEVQLAGAQELATYLEEKESLEKLIPVLNDMTAQQYGFNATQESSAQIASMLGKVMEGQVSALSRYGYSFDEAQEQILKFGTESERAAVLADVVSQSVGGMNAALAQTDAGKQKQLENTLGDIQEQLGGLVQNLMPYISGLAAMSNAAGGVIKLTEAYNTLDIKQKAASASGAALAVHQKVQAVAQKLLSASGYSAAAGTTALTVATTALYAALTLGISVVVTGLVALFSSLGDEAEEAAGEMNDLKEAQDAFTSAAAGVKAEIDTEVSKLKDLIGSHGDARKAVDDLNKKYGEAFGYHKTAEEWYETLTTKSKAYCAQLGYEAQAKVIASKKAAKELALEAAKDKVKSLEDGGGAKNSRSVTGPSGYTIHYEDETDEYRKAKAEVSALDEEVKGLEKSWDACTAKIREATEELNAGGQSDQGGNWQTMNYTELGKAIDAQTKKVKDLAGADEAEAAKEAKLLSLMIARKNGLDKKYSLGGGSGSGVNVKGNNQPTSDALIQAALAEMEALVQETIDGWNFDKSIELTTVLNEPLPMEEEEPDLSAQDQLIERLEHRQQIYDQLAQSIERLKGLSQYASGEELAAINAQIAAAKKHQQALGKTDPTPQVSSFKKYQKQLQKVREEHEASIESVNAIGSTMGALGQAVGGAAGEWLTWGANLAQSIAAAIPQIMALVAAHSEEATANTASAATGAASSVASIPYVGPILAVAAVASVLASLASLPKFANGAVAYGPTLGLFGEYAGASSNPEVVAPLSKLRELIEPDGGAVASELFGKVDFKIRGRRLEGVLEKERKIRSRRGGRS